MANQSTIKGNPFLGTLAVGGIAGVVIGLGLIVSYEPGLFDTGIGEEVLIGSSLLSLGLFLLIGWLIAGAIIWRPESDADRAERAPAAQAGNVEESAHKAD